MLLRRYALWKKNVNAVIVNARDVIAKNADVQIVNNLMGVSRLRRCIGSGECRWSTSINDLKLIEKR